MNSSPLPSAQLKRNRPPGDHSVQHPPLPKVSSDLVLQVFTHISLRRTAESVEDYGDNERFIHLGQVVLDAAVTGILFNKRPILTTQEIISEREAALSDDHLNKWVTLYNLRSKLRCHPNVFSTLNDPKQETRSLFCSYIGGVYVENGMETVQEWINQLLIGEVEDVVPVGSQLPENEPRQGPPFERPSKKAKSEELPPYLSTPTFFASQPPPSPPMDNQRHLPPHMHSVLSMQRPVLHMQPLVPLPNPLAPAQPSLPFLPLFNQTAAQRRVVVAYPAEFSGPPHAGQWSVQCIGNLYSSPSPTASNSSYTVVYAMTSESAPGNISSLSPLYPSFNQPPHIDLTQDEDDGNDHHGPERFAKRLRMDSSLNMDSPSIFVQQDPRPSPLLNQQLRMPISASSFTSSNLPRSPYRPPFAGPSNFAVPNHPSTQQLQQSNPSFIVAPRSLSIPSSRQVIDLTSSPSPPPTMHQQETSEPALPPDLSPKAPVCIGQLSVTALVLYPVPYLRQQDSSNDSEWAQVRLQYEHKPNKQSAPETINIRAPHARGPSGEQILGEAFAVVEQKVATAIGPMLGKGLIRVDAKLRRGPPNVTSFTFLVCPSIYLSFIKLPILPLQMLVYTPKGNIPVVGDYLRQVPLLLDHPTLPYDIQRLSNFHYHNPHNPPPGGHNRPIMAQNRLYGPPSGIVPRWTGPAISGRSVEVQRTQVEEIFKNFREDDLIETESATEISTKLYPHQKKALTFLLDREREKPASGGQFSSLWRSCSNPLSGRTSWIHLITEKEVFDEPRETKGSILADDMGLGKTITCVSLIAATLQSAKMFANTPLEVPHPPPPALDYAVDPNHFSGSVWAMPPPSPAMSQKQKAQNAKIQEKLEAQYARASRIKAKSRATLIVCPLSTVANWEDQLKEHWNGQVTVLGGSGGTCGSSTPSQSMSQLNLTPTSSNNTENKATFRVRSGAGLRVYVYHGNARRPDPAFLADFDCVITTFATLASEFSKQNRCATITDEDEEEGASSDTTAGVDFDPAGHPIVKLSRPQKTGQKRKKTATAGYTHCEASSPLQSVHWFRVVLDEAHSIKEPGTVGSRASCDLMADRRLCLTGTPVQNKLDDLFALIKFLRLEQLEEKSVWTEFVGSPVKFQQPTGFSRLQTIMKCITLRRTKESETQDGRKILALPPRRDEKRLLKFSPAEQEIYDQFFNESKAEFTELTSKNEVMKNYVGILQRILRLRQICDHFELVEGKKLQDQSQSYEGLVADILKDGLNVTRASAVFAILRESATTQCVECGTELCISADLSGDGPEVDGPSTIKRGRKANSSASRGPTRASSPSNPRPILTRCQHLFCLECYRTSICPSWPEVASDSRRSCSACQTGLSPSDAIEIKPEMSTNTTTITKKKTSKREKRPKAVFPESFHSSTKVKALITDLMHFSRANPHSTNYDPSTIEIQMVDDKGNDVDDGVVKTVVFSQWTSMLDKIEDALEYHGIHYDRLDGTMKRDERSRAMDELKYNPQCEVLLVSLKAGGVGLNLTAAQRVYLMDPYWCVLSDTSVLLTLSEHRNPAVENQAVDRIHRLGQTKPVTAIKFIIENSIEARLLEVQRKKIDLANMTLGDNFTRADLMQRRMDELQHLFN
ncbi:hypothetical protein H0H93_014154 [Arthromyces matolae]|nr:hypothetical protein H0H93_014154 [Arthromyces matolae]